MFDSFPYFDYHDINLDWLICRMKEFLKEFGTLEGNWEAFKKYVEKYLEDISVDESVRNILNEWLDDGTIQELLLSYNTKVLTSNDIDIQNLYTYIMDDNRTISGGSPAYPVFQGMAITEGGAFLTISNDEFS